MKTTIAFTAILAAVLFSGCLSPQSYKNHGGTSTVTTGPTNGVNFGVLKQGDNPNSTTRQSLNQDREITVEAPAGASVEVDGVKVDSTYSPLPIPVPAQVAVKPGVSKSQCAAPIKVTLKNNSHNDVSLGSSFKNTIEETAAKLRSLSVCYWAGFAFLALGVFMLTPWGSFISINRLTPVVCFTIGGALIVLPSLLVGHEALIIGIGGGGFLLYYFWHHSVDANQNGIPDMLEKWFDKLSDVFKPHPPAAPPPANPTPPV